MDDTVSLRLDLSLETLNNCLVQLAKSRQEIEEKDTHQKHNGQAGLHLLESNAIFDADHLLLVRHSLFETLENNVGETGNHLKAVVGCGDDPCVKDFVRSSSKLVFSIMS